jgi:DNA-binding LacI/PurR family transcriptional regulator
LGQLAAKTLLERIGGTTPRQHSVDVGFQVTPREST